MVSGLNIATIDDWAAKILKADIQATKYLVYLPLLTKTAWESAAPRVNGRKLDTLGD